MKKTTMRTASRLTRFKEFIMVPTLCAVLSVMTSCDEFLNIPPPTTELAQANVFEEDDTVISAISGIYNAMSQSLSFAGGGTQSVGYLEGVYADELTLANGSPSTLLPPFYYNNITADNQQILNYWSGAYSAIYSANSIIEGLDKSIKVSQDVKAQVQGEAYFIRAFAHFYLVNLFGPIPYIATTDYRANATVSATPVSEVYDDITQDLLKATDLLSDNYPSAGRVRPNKAAATALLARVYLYRGEWVSAEQTASQVLNDTIHYRLTLPKDTFIANSNEAIWQLLPGGGTMNYTSEGSAYIIVSIPKTVTLSDELYAEFDAEDLRRQTWIGTYSTPSASWHFPYKYKENGANATGAEYSMVLRLAELYLIRAEARVHLNKLIGANSGASDINAIRKRAGLSNTSATSMDDLLMAIEKERRLELFSEWGHRFFDLKRTGRVDAILGAIKANWKTTDALLPIPKSEILTNPNLAKTKPS